MWCFLLVWGDYGAILKLEHIGAFHADWELIYSNIQYTSVILSLVRSFQIT